MRIVCWLIVVTVLVATAAAVAGWLRSDPDTGAAWGWVAGGNPSNAAVDLANWPPARVQQYQSYLARIASWAKATYPTPSVNPNVNLPPSLNDLITHGPIEAVVMADGQVLLLVQFEDDNLSTDSTGVVFATRPIGADELRAVRAWAQRFSRTGYVWHVDLIAPVTASLYTADVDESPR